MDLNFFTYVLTVHKKSEYFLKSIPEYWLYTWILLLRLYDMVSNRYWMITNIFILGEIVTFVMKIAKN